MCFFLKKLINNRTGILNVFFFEKELPLTACHQKIISAWFCSILMPVVVIFLVCYCCLSLSSLSSVSLLSLLFVVLSHLPLHVHDEYSARSVAHHKLFRIPRHHVNRVYGDVSRNASYGWLKRVKTLCSFYIPKL